MLARLPEMEREAENYERKARALRQIIEGVKALNGRADAILAPRFVEQNGKVFVAAPQDRRGPRGIEAVRQVMASDSERVWKVIELKNEILRRGWAPSPKAVEANVKRLRELGEITSVAYGYYKLASQEADETAARTNVEGSDGEVRQ
jgi:hypothetical protein